MLDERIDNAYIWFLRTTESGELKKTFKSLAKARKNADSILILCQLFYPELISTGQILTELAEELVKLRMDVNVICGPPTILDRKSKVPRHLVHEGIKVRRVFGTRFSKLNLAGKFLNQLTYTLGAFFRLILSRSKKTMLVLTDPPFLGLICAVLEKFRNRPYVFLMFDVYPDTAVKLGVLRDNGLIARLWDRCNNFVLRKASNVIVLGRCMKSVVLDKGRDIKSLPRKTHVIPMWSDDRRIHPVRTEENPFRKKWNLEGRFVVSYSGNMGRFHDMETIMESAKVLDDNENIRFLFIGEGHKKKWMEEYARKWKLDNCQFHTYVPREDLGFSLACADLGLVSLAPGQEGLSVPSKTFGILAAGIPVIAVMNRNSEIAVVIEENDCGFVIEPGNSKALAETIERLYSDQGLRQKLGKNGLLAIKNEYNLRNVARKYYSVLRSIQS